jgi:carbamoyltransferase
MMILGLNQIPSSRARKHDSAVAIICDGKVIASAEEERFNRIKHTYSQATQALNYCLKTAGISLKEIDIVAISNNPYALFRNWYNDYNYKALIYKTLTIAHSEYSRRKLTKEIKGHVRYINHHLSHAASGYYWSDFTEANILVIDGRGESETFSFFVAQNKTIKCIWRIPLKKNGSGSIGHSYSSVTQSLGLGMFGEGKTMGLASYGQPNMNLTSVFNISDHNNYQLDNRGLKKICRSFARIDTNESFTRDQMDLATSTQHALENGVIALAKEAYEFSGIRNFVLAGGVALNCNLNSRLLAEDFCERVFIPPAANDSGLALGAALYVANSKESLETTRAHHPYLGPEYDDEKIESTLKRGKYPYKRIDHIEKETAEAICSGKIVGWFQGRMELGPRALGNRSILADPTITGMNDRVNAEVKNRELWRPFGPSVTADAAGKYFEGFDKVRESPFMLHTFQVRKKYQKILSAITHVDGSTRPQTVSPEQNQRLYKLLKAVESINGHPVLLNTSFNVDDEPIVCTPENAIACFFNSGLDVLVMGNYMIRK